VDDTWFRVDLLFFHRQLRCLVVIDLKVGHWLSSRRSVARNLKPTGASGPFATRPPAAARGVYLQKKFYAAADKAEAHRRIRREVGEVLRKDPCAEILPHERELSDPWDMDKDGKGRFDPQAFPKLMRK
jgi:hypothetical protein